MDALVTVNGAWVSVTCPNCKRVIGYDNDDYKQIQALKCPHCKRWFYMADAKIEVIPVKRHPMLEIEQ